MKIAAVIVAAGRGVRAGGGVPKQWRPLAGHTSADYAVAAFANHRALERVVLVLHPDDVASRQYPTGVEIVTGGATRSQSVLAGLEHLEGACDKVLIHDAARPCISHAVIDGVITALRTHQAAAPAIEVVDALWRGKDGQVAETVDRTALYRAQTPQGFDLSAILAAHRRFPDGAADDVELARCANLSVAITRGHEDNLKITLAEDFERAERILRARDGH